MGEQDLEIRTRAARKLPVHFGSTARALFGFYHPADEGIPQRDTGVVLCPPIGTDHVRSDWTYRKLAERLAARGFPCLRFDLSGTGDSGDAEASGDQVREWIDDIGAAVQELRERSGAKRTSLFGLRLGAALAGTYAAERGGVESLVLWSPCVTGKGFVEEIRRLHVVYSRIEPHVAKAPPPGEGAEEALGLLLPRALVEALSRIDLLQMGKSPARRALLVDGGGVLQRDALVAHLRSHGAEVDLEQHPGHKFLVTVSHRQVLPEAPIASVVQWLDRTHPEQTTARGEARASVHGPVGERPVLFGARRTLFGIFTPARGSNVPATRPAIVIANAGCVNRQGPHGLFARAARRWAGLGFDVLRVDLAGIGDSPAAPGTQENLTYPSSGMDDLAEAMRATGRSRAIVAGLCSGGDYAFQLGARKTVGSVEVAGAWLLNPRTFCVLDLTAVESGTPPTTPVADVPKTLRSMAEGGADVVLMVSRGDPGVAYVDEHASADMRALSSVSNFARVDIEDADHPFSPVSVQERITRWLGERLAARH